MFCLKPVVKNLNFFFAGGRSMIAQDGSLSEKSKPIEGEVASNSENRTQRTSEAATSTSAASVGFITSHLSAASIASSTESSAGSIVELLQWNAKIWILRPRMHCPPDCRQKLSSEIWTRPIQTRFIATIAQSGLPGFYLSESGFWTPDCVWDLDGGHLSEIWTSLDFGIPLYF